MKAPTAGSYVWKAFMWGGGAGGAGASPGSLTFPKKKKTSSARYLSYASQDLDSKVSRYREFKLYVYSSVGG